MDVNSDYLSEPRLISNRKWDKMVQSNLCSAVINEEWRYDRLIQVPQR